MWLQRCRRSFLAILLKDAYDRCFLRPQVTPRPARTHAACVSLSLSTMSISSGDHSPVKQPTTGAKTSRIPLSGNPAAQALSVGFRHEGPQHNSAAPLSDPAYMTSNHQVSSTPNKKNQKSRKRLKSSGICSTGPVRSHPGGVDRSVLA